MPQAGIGDDLGFDACTCGKPAGPSGLCAECFLNCESTDSLFTIICGKCGQMSAALKWCETPISGELPIGEFQCPKCGFAFRRERFAGDPFRLINGKWKY